MLDELAVTDLGVIAHARLDLRDHMTDIELILTMLGEATTTKLHRDRDSVIIATGSMGRKLLSTPG